MMDIYLNWLLYGMIFGLIFDKNVFNIILDKNFTVGNVVWLIIQLPISIIVIVILVIRKMFNSFFKSKFVIGFKKIWNKKLF